MFIMMVKAKGIVVFACRGLLDFFSFIIIWRTSDSATDDHDDDAC